MPITPTTYGALTAMITPAIFMTANASLIISTSNRVSRVVDRIRVLNDQADKLDRGVTDLDFPDRRLEHFHDQMRRLERRSDRLRFALTALYLAFTLFVGTSLTLAIDTMLNNWLVALPTLLAVVGVGLLLFASVNLVLEALEALRSNRLETRFYRDLHQYRQTGDDLPAFPPLPLHDPPGTHRVNPGPRRQAVGHRVANARREARPSCLLRDGRRPGSRPTGHPGAGGVVSKRVLQLGHRGWIFRSPVSSRFSIVSSPSRTRCVGHRATIREPNSRSYSEYAAGPSDDLADAAGSSRTRSIRP